MPINHRQVEIFRAIMEAGSLTAAAQALHSSQPTLSRELARMEERLGLRLFNRGAVKLTPTAAALRLYEGVQAHYRGLRHIQDQALALARQEEQALEVLALPALAHALLPQALQHCPPAPLTITPAENPWLDQWMSEQRFDLAVAESHHAPSGCHLEVVADLDEVVVLPAGHPLLAQPSLDLADLAGQPFISLASNDPYRQGIDQAFAHAGIQRIQRLQTHSAVAVCALVQAGLGLSIVNPLTARACAGPGLHWRPLRHSIPFTVSLIFPSHRPQHRLQPILAAALRSALRAHQSC
ncbi:DNA-binding transcriptional LysR family regulator [Inhella inkyongensis]|uniref:DNA-binding transcriptional LysR family regulator n=1 Tax=Inhella inkyongensis TaxID=392593 RepID=A0A840S5G8_9BURK|nr:LysR family transcriptional regulator [Inhella inkyongensis]MBB5204266.1 DNA-binding transcriptional LysR family regulator [Inhella inkyongensis]